MSLAHNLSDAFNERARDALHRYLTELVRLYPAAPGRYRVGPWPGYRQIYLVSIDPLQDEDAWITLNEAMAKIATGLVAETDYLFVPTVLEELETSG
jgi:hypothetical protein